MATSGRDRGSSIAGGWRSRDLVNRSFALPSTRSANGTRRRMGKLG